MSNSYFQFKQFTIHQEHCAMKVCTDACLFGAWIADIIQKEKWKTESILDVGTGTGLLSLMIAQKSDAKIDAVEIDEIAAAQAAENMEASPWQKRMQVICGDARNVHLGKKYDLIISNPPFFNNDLKSDDGKRNLALHSEALGFEELIAVMHNYLHTDGKFAVLLPYHRRDDFMALALQNNFFAGEEVSVRQTPTHDYFRSMILFGRMDGLPIHHSFAIREEENYTAIFSDLLKSYYLNL